MDHFLTVDQVVGFRDEIHQRGQAASPIIEDSVDIVRLRDLEVDDAIQSIHLCCDRLVADQVGEELLRFFSGQI